MTLTIVNLKESLRTRVRQFSKSFLYYIAKGNEIIYLILLSLFIFSNLLLMIGWKPKTYVILDYFYLGLFTAVMWLSAIYLFLVIAEWRKAWKHIWKLILIGVLIFLVTGIISRFFTGHSYNAFMGAFLCLMAYGKDYRKILYCFLISFIFALLIGLIGLPLGITFDAAKPHRAYGGHSLGILYPNNWGFLVFNVLAIIWYLFLQNRKLITVILFWLVSVFMFYYITCLTIAGLTFGFPLLVFIFEFFQDRTINHNNKNRLISFFFIVLPFLTFSIMMILCWQMDWVYNTFYNTPLESFAMRFVEGGYSLKVNGFHLFGQPFKQTSESIIEYSREIEMIVDSAYVAYLILRGIVWMIIVLLWLSFSHYRALKRKDYRIIAISLLFLIFCAMERPGLDVWYNFVFLYPLASTAVSSATSHKTTIAEET